MTRPLLEPQRIHAAAQSQIEAHAGTLVAEVETLIARHPVVVIGMSGNPFVGQARKALDAAGVAHHDVDFGSYFSQWRRRNILKMWCGWPTFPMVFVRGTLIGGATDLNSLIASGELQRLLG